MKKTWTFVLSTATLWSSTLGFSFVQSDVQSEEIHSQKAQEQVYVGEVTKGVDGDTIHFRSDEAAPGEKDWNIRMIGIDAPESHFPIPIKGSHPAKQDPWGQLASDYIAEILPLGSQVTLTSFGKDKYRRVLGRVEYKGEDINLSMVRAGWAVPYIICDGAFCDSDFMERQHVKEYIEACDLARKEGLGVFNPKKPMKQMPYEFRTEKRQDQPTKYVGDYDTHVLYAPKDYKQVDLCRRIFFLTQSAAKKVGFTLQE